MIFACLLSAIALLPADRLAMADRLFNRARYAEAASEYALLAGEPSVAADELLFRQAECARALGKTDAAGGFYRKLFGAHPDSRHAPRARLAVALAEKGDERVRLLKALDSDRVPAAIRAAALYHLGVETQNADLLARAVTVDPKGEYADHARFRRGSLMIASSEAKVRSQGIELLLAIAFGKGQLAEEALQLAAEQCYREHKYGEAGSLLRRYLKKYPQGRSQESVKTLAVWCDYLEGRYADVAAAVEGAGSDDFAYLKAACAQAQGNAKSALELYRGYLEAYPAGTYRPEAELALSRMEFATATASGDRQKSVESARRIFAKSKSAADGLRLAWAYEQAKQDSEADGAYAMVAKDFAGSAEAASALFARALLVARLGNWSKAELLLAESIATGRLGERTASAYYWRGVAALRTDHETEGVGFLQKALELGLGLDESREARLMIADCDLRAGRQDAARTAYVKLIAEGAAARMSAQRLYAVAKLVDGQTASTCAEQLIRTNSAEWRQIGHALRGYAEEKREAWTAAVEDYRAALAESVQTEELSTVALRLGRLEFRAGEYVRAEATLRTAVKLNSASARARAEAYVALAKTAEARGDYASVRGYATVVSALFDDPELKAAAEQVLKAHPEGSDR